MVLASGIAVLVAGCLIGATGIGGVLVVPALTHFEGMVPAHAIAAAALAFAFPGAAAVMALRRNPQNAAGMLPLLAGAIPGALGGALVVHRVDSRWLLGGLAIVALVSGVRGLLPRTSRDAPAPELHGGALAALGVFVGVGSALTGTGGPVLLVPLLVWLRQPLLRTIAAAQAIQFPLALCAATVHAASGALDVKLACVLGIALLAGSLVGDRAARRIPLRGLQILVCLLLLAVGSWLAWQAFHPSMT